MPINLPVGNVRSSEEAVVTQETVRPLREEEKDIILRALRITGGNKAEAAKLLKISTKTIYNKLASYEPE